MIQSLGWGTFLLWGVFDVVIAVGSFFFLKETKGLSLEDIAHQKFQKGGTSEHVDLAKRVDEGDDVPRPP